MFRGLADMADGEKIIPFVKQFYDSPSTFLWENDTRDVRRVRQGEGGKQGDPLMFLFSLSQHRAMVAVQAELKEGKRLFAFFDRHYVVCSPDRIGQIYLLEEQLKVKTGMSIHQRKTKLWNAAGCKPAMADMLTVVAKRRSPEAVVWRGDQGLPKSEQGMKVLGVPVGHKEFIKAQLRISRTIEIVREDSRR